MELFEAMRTTFAARDYTGEELPDDVLYDILDNARFAPSGGNRQGAHVIVVRDPATRNALGELAREAATRYTAQVTAGESPWNTVVPTQVTAEDIAHTEPAPQLIETCKTCSVVLVFTVDLKVIASMDQYLDRVGIISGGSIYPLAWNTLLAARAAGFGGTITTLAISKEDQIKELLNIPEDFAVAAVMPLGKPVKQLTKLRRRPVEDFVTRESFNGAAFTKP